MIRLRHVDTRLDLLEKWIRQLEEKNDALERRTGELEAALGASTRSFRMDGSISRRFARMESWIHKHINKMRRKCTECGVPQGEIYEEDKF